MKDVEREFVVFRTLIDFRLSALGAELQKYSPEDLEHLLAIGKLARPKATDASTAVAHRVAVDLLLLAQAGLLGSRPSKAAEPNHWEFDPAIAGAIINGRTRRIPTLRGIAENSLGPLSEDFWRELEPKWKWHDALPVEKLTAPTRLQSEPTDDNAA